MAPHAMRDSRPVMVAENGRGPYGNTVEVGGLTFLADETAAAGGENRGPGPFDLLKAALGTSVAMTVRWLARQRKLPLSQVSVIVEHERGPSGEAGVGDVLRATVALIGALNEAERTLLVRAAERCPINRMLVRTVRVEVQVLDAPADPGPV